LRTPGGFFSSDPEKKFPLKKVLNVPFEMIKVVYFAGRRGFPDLNVLLMLAATTSRQQH